MKILVAAVAFAVLAAPQQASAQEREGSPATQQLEEIMGFYLAKNGRAEWQLQPNSGLRYVRVRP